MVRKRVSVVSRNAPFLPSKQAHARSPLGANFHLPFFCVDGYGLTLNLSENKRIGEIRTKTRILHPYHLFGREMAKIQPLTLTLDPKLINFYACVSFMYRNHWVTSDVQFRKGASIPPFWVGLGWADLWHVVYVSDWHLVHCGAMTWTVGSPCFSSALVGKNIPLLEGDSANFQSYIDDHIHSSLALVHKKGEQKRDVCKEYSNAHLLWVMWGKQRCVQLLLSLVDGACNVDSIQQRLLDCKSKNQMAR